MNKLKLLIPIVFILLNSGCASFGPTVRIETPEPAEDFVVVCGWYSGPGIFSGSGSEESHKVFITESGKEVDCGLGFEARNQVSIMHPLYTNMQGVSENGISVIRPKNKMQILDEQKAKFEAGYWDKYRNPGSEYVRNLAGCGFPYQYFNYYNEENKIDRKYFQQKYHFQILKCMQREYEELKKYDSYTAVRVPNAEESMKLLWSHERWSKYE